MKLSQALCRQHLDRMFKKHWKIQGQRVASETGAEKELQARGIPVYNPKDILFEKPVFEKVAVVGIRPPPQPLDETHPLYQEQVCLMYRDHNVLLEGLDQAKIITKTVEVQSGFPVDFAQIGKDKESYQDDLVQRFVLSAHVFDAMQEKLPRLHDPTRPAWKFPRVFGITDQRCNRRLSSKLLQLCESMEGASKGRYLLEDRLVTLPIEKDEDLIQFELTVDFLLMSKTPLPVSSENTQDIALPDLNPIKHTITLEKEQFYNPVNYFPFADSKAFTVHTAIFHYNPTQVKNIFETPVTETQILGRTLMKSFALAASHARQKYGDDVTDLPKPIMLQSVQSDGRNFQFIMFQLNTLNLDGVEGLKNIVWVDKKKELFSCCEYQEGKPILTGYNPEVFQTLLAFYRNGYDV